MGGNEQIMQVSVCFKYCLALLIFGVSCWMTWREANGSWDELTLAKGISPLQGSASVSACCPNLVAELNTVTLDSENSKITTTEEKDEDARLAVFENANFYINIKKLDVSPIKKKTLTQPLKHYTIQTRPIWSILYTLRMMQSMLQLIGPQTVIQRRKI